MGPVFLYLFQKFPNIRVQIYSFGLGFTFGVEVEGFGSGVWFRSLV